MLKIEFYFSKELSALGFINYAFAPPHSLKRMRIYSPLISPWLLKATKIYESIRGEKGWEKAFLSLAKGQPAPNDVVEFSRFLTDFYSPDAIKKLTIAVQKVANDLQTPLKQELKILLGTNFNLKLTGFLSPNFSAHHLNGSAVGSVVFCLVKAGVFSPKEVFDLILHEALHAYIKRTGVSLQFLEPLFSELEEKTAGGENQLEELFVNLLAPRGILSHRLGLIKSLSWEDKIAGEERKWVAKGLKKLKRVLDKFSSSSQEGKSLAEFMAQKQPN